MALLLSDVQSYLNSLAPVKQPEPVCTIDTATVQYFYSYPNTNLHYADPSLVPHDISFSDPNDEVLLNIICSAIEWETDNGLYLTPLDIIELAEDEATSDHVAEAIGDVIDKNIDAFPQQIEKLTLLQSVKQSILFSNSWEIFDNILGKFADPAYPDAMIVLLDDALRLVGIAPDCHKEFEHMAEMLLGMASGHLSQYWLFGENRIENNDKAKMPEELRPATIYRRWAKIVRNLAQSFKAARSLIKEIVLEQTLPQAELDSPDWIDQYTLELDPAAEKEFVSVKAGKHVKASSAVLNNPIVLTATAHGYRPADFSVPKTQQWYDIWEPAMPVKKQQPSWCADPNLAYLPLPASINQTDEELVIFAAAQETFGEGEEVEEEWSNEIGHEAAEPMFMKMQHDFQSTERIKQLREFMSKPASDCRERIKRIVSDNWSACAAQLAKLARSNFPKVNYDFLLEACEHTLAYPENKSAKHANISFKLWDMFSLEIKAMKKAYKLPEKGKAEWRDAFEASSEARAFLDLLQSLIVNEESPVDVALLFLSLQTDFGFTPEIASMIKLRTAISNSINLYQYIEANEDDILANLSGDAISNDEISEEEIEIFCAETMEMLVAQGVPGAKDISKTPEYIRGYMNAAFNSSTGETSTCIAAGWDAWRQAKSPAANLAYYQAIKDGATPKDAMKLGFWPVVNRAERKIKEGRIVGTTSMGLTLSSGRKIDWHIAALKFKADELLLTAEDIARLRDRLVKGGYGKELVAVLS